MTDDNDWQQKVAQWAASMGATPENSKPKLTQRESSALEQARMDKVVFQPVTVTSLRIATEDHTRAVYTAAGHSREDAERLTTTHMDTITDDMLVASWQQAGRDIAARKAREAADAIAADNAKKAAAKIKRDHQDRLDREKTATAVALEEAEVWEKRSKTLEGQLSALMKRQGK